MNYAYDTDEPITAKQLHTARLLMKPLAGEEPLDLREAARAVGVSHSELDRALWQTLGQR